MEHESNNFGPPAELPQPQEVNEQTAPEHTAAPLPETRGLKMPKLTPPAQQPTPPGPLGPSSHPINPNPTPATSTNPASSALIADDADLIEKEWVTRAKAIVMQTKDDPHAQNHEMSKVKADYLKKRYNKDLKVSEG